jgi:hypothetical protein
MALVGWRSGRGGGGILVGLQRGQSCLLTDALLQFYIFASVVEAVTVFHGETPFGRSAYSIPSFCGSVKGEKRTVRIRFEKSTKIIDK